MKREAKMETKKIRNFRNLDLWQLGKEILEYLGTASKGTILEKLNHESRMIRNLIKKL